MENTASLVLWDNVRKVVTRNVANPREREILQGKEKLTAKLIRQLVMQ